MRKRLLAGALCGLLLAAISADVAGAHHVHVNDWNGTNGTQCEPATHVAYYDFRRDGQTVWDLDNPNGDHVFYVDDDPTKDFSPTGNYSSPSHDCDGTPVLRASAYVAANIEFEAPPFHKMAGYPWCPRGWYDNRNPGCERENTASAGVFVAQGDGSNGTGKEVIVMPLNHP